MSNWRGTIFILPKGPEDWDVRFASFYPVPAKWMQVVTDFAGTHDVDASVLKSAAALLADAADIMERSRVAMATRKATAMDRLCVEITDFLNLGGGATTPSLEAAAIRWLSHYDSFEHPLGDEPGIPEMRAALNGRRGVNPQDDAE